MTLYWGYVDGADTAVISSVGVCVCVSVCVSLYAKMFLLTVFHMCPMHSFPPCSWLCASACVPAISGVCVQRALKATCARSTSTTAKITTARTTPRALMESTTTHACAHQSTQVTLQPDLYSQFRCVPQTMSPRYPNTKTLASLMML